MKSISIDDALHLRLDDVIARLGSHVDYGLTAPEASSRLVYSGANVLKTDDPEPLWKKFLEQFKEPMILLLLASAGISLLTQQFDDAVSITLVIRGRDGPVWYC